MKKMLTVIWFISKTVVLYNTPMDHLSKAFGGFLSCRPNSFFFFLNDNLPTMASLTFVLPAVLAFMQSWWHWIKAHSAVALIACCAERLSQLNAVNVKKKSVNVNALPANYMLITLQSAVLGCGSHLWEDWRGLWQVRGSSVFIKISEWGKHHLREWLLLCSKDLVYTKVPLSFT